MTDARDPAGAAGFPFPIFPDPHSPRAIAGQIGEFAYYCLCEAVLREREACAKIADETLPDSLETVPSDQILAGMKQDPLGYSRNAAFITRLKIAELIRARGKIPC